MKFNYLASTPGNSRGGSSSWNIKIWGVKLFFSPLLMFFLSLLFTVTTVTNNNKAQLKANTGAGFAMLQQNAKPPPL